MAKLITKKKISKKKKKKLIKKLLGIFFGAAYAGT